VQGVRAYVAPEAVESFGRGTHPATQVEVVTAQQDEIHRGLLDGGFDLGLVNYLPGDDMPPDLQTTELLRGKPVVCIRPDSPLAALPAIPVAVLLTEPLIVMRSGYVMHRYVHRLFAGRAPSFSYSADGAEMGKLMVAEGLGATLLPDYSIVGDPLERSGAITHRPIEDDTTEVFLTIQRRRSASVPAGVRSLHRIFAQYAETYREDTARTRLPVA